MRDDGVKKPRNLYYKGTRDEEEAKKEKIR